MILNTSFFAQKSPSEALCRAAVQNHSLFIDLAVHPELVQ